MSSIAWAKSYQLHDQQVTSTSYRRASQNSSDGKSSKSSKTKGKTLKLREGFVQQCQALLPMADFQIRFCRFPVCEAPDTELRRRPGKRRLHCQFENARKQKLLKIWLKYSTKTNTRDLEKRGEQVSSRKLLSYKQVCLRRCKRIGVANGATAARC